MRKFKVEVRPDHLRQMANVRRPVLAVAELIWNGLDADAPEVRVVLDRDALGTINAIRVIDTGHGMTAEQAEAEFRGLGGSWKKESRVSRTKGRLLHGRSGKGRFRAFALGDVVEWVTRAKNEGTMQETRIVGSLDALGEFGIEEAVVEADRSGTTVTVSEVTKNFRTLEPSEAIPALTEQLAIYLREYPEVRVYYEEQRLDPAHLEEHVAEYELDAVPREEGPPIEGTLEVIEWAVKVDRSLFLCDEAGFALDEMSPGIQAPGLVFTAYLRSSYIRELEENEVLTLGGMTPELESLVESAKEKLRFHYRQRQSLAATRVVEDWKRENIYPYTDPPRSPIEEAERQVFDVLALNVNEFLPSFAESPSKAKKFSLTLLKQGLEESPESLQRIMTDVLELPSSKRDELANLLERSSLSAIIAASKVVADRLDFLLGLESLIFDPATKALVKERSQLHRILENETWVFGEEFNLTASDRSLTNVLRAHIGVLGREELVTEPVLDEGGSRRIVDLMLSRTIPQPRADQHEHLIVELKRPTVAIGHEELQQVHRYALMVANDDRFKDTETKWTFFAVSTRISDEARQQARQRNRPEGLSLDSDDGKIQVWVKTWSEILDACRARLRFFADRLEYSPDEESALDYLRRLHSEYLPDVADGGSESGR